MFCILSFFVCAMWIGCACQSAAPSPATPIPPLPSEDSQGAGLNPGDFTELLAKAAQTGSVRVIVTLELGTPFLPEGNLPDEAAIQAQREAIQKAQETLLKTVEPYSYKVEFQPEITPQIILTIDEAGLSALIAAPIVLGIQEDAPDQPSP